MKKFLLISCLFMGGVGFASAQTANKATPVKKAEKQTVVPQTESSVSKQARPKTAKSTPAAAQSLFEATPVQTKQSAKKQ